MIQRCVSVLSLLLLFIGFGLAPANATNYYVASGVTYGSATNVPTVGVDDRSANVNSSGYARGTIQYPFKTIQYAAKQAIAGDTVTVRDGLYNENVYIGQNSGSTFITSQSGTANAHITFTAEHRGLAYVRGSSTYDGVFYIKSAAFSDVGWSNITTKIGYIDILGFDIASTGYDGKGVLTTWAHHISIRDCNVHNCGSGGIVCAYSDYIIMYGNNVYDNCRTSSWNGSGLDIYLASAWDTAAGYHNYIRGNTAYNNYIQSGALHIITNQPIDHTDGNGIIVDIGYRNTLTLIENNLVYNNGGRGIILDGVQNVDILNNTCYHNCTDTAISGNNEEINMQQVYWFEGDLGPTYAPNSISKNIKVQDNICVPSNGKSCIAVQNTTTNVSITNNWLYSANSSTLITYPLMSHAGFASPNPVNRTTQAWTIQGNYGLAMTYAGGDPLFVSPGTSSSANFRLQSGSGCKDKSVNHPTYDRDWYARPYSPTTPYLYDIGAYEYHP